jgi:hypothetical protein
MSVSVSPQASRLATAAEQHARLIDQPRHDAPSDPRSDNEPASAQALATGPAGIALTHIERAASGHASWRTAHAWIQDAVSRTISDHDSAGLFFGVPAVAFMLDAATDTTSGRYRAGLADVDRPVARLAHRQAARVLARIEAGGLSSFAEYDVFAGLSGISALLLRRYPDGSAIEHTLTALVALTKPLRVCEETLPGWWVQHGQHRDHTLPGGHANFGIAHGVPGVLAALSQAARRGVLVEGQHEAIDRICCWLQAWRHEAPTGPWWPETITREQLHARHSNQPSATRPSWCYGTPGIARAGQLAAIALADRRRQRAYEHALLCCLNDPAQLAQLSDPGLCHGWAGLYQTVWRAAADATTPELAQRLPMLADHLLAAADRPHQHGAGLLDGTAGLALVLHTAATSTAPSTGWDACLLID